MFNNNNSERADGTSLIGESLTIEGDLSCKGEIEIAGIMNGNIRAESLKVLEDDIRQSISNWLPYVNINNLVSFQDDRNPNQVLITLEYSTEVEPDALDTISFEIGICPNSGIPKRSLSLKPPPFLNRSNRSS